MLPQLSSTLNSAPKTCQSIASFATSLIPAQDTRAVSVHQREPTCTSMNGATERERESENAELKYHLKFHRSLIELSSRKVEGCLLVHVTANARAGDYFYFPFPPITLRLGQVMFAEGAGPGEAPPARGTPSYPFDPPPPKIRISLIEFADTETSISNVFFSLGCFSILDRCRCHGAAANAFTMRRWRAWAHKLWPMPESCSTVGSTQRRIICTFIIKLISVRHNSISMFSGPFSGPMARRVDAKGGQLR